MPSFFDGSAFIAGLKLADARVRKAVRRALAIELAKAEHRLKELAPIASGTLSASGAGDIKGIKEDVGGGGMHGLLTAGGGEASDYAVRQHEEVFHHRFPTDGTYASKYVETPLKEAVASLPVTVAAECRKALSGNGGGGGSGSGGGGGQ